MVFKRESVEERLKKLSELFRFFEIHKELTYERLMEDITVSLAIERASALAAEIIIDILSHILTSEYNLFPETYRKGYTLSWNEPISELV
ncbi:MAG: hypothetical protein HY752_01545 [Nitrospirae bacterium]|nr:hypothetical protein [Nitrospirota bacterium]